MTTMSPAVALPIVSSPKVVIWPNSAAVTTNCPEPPVAPRSIVRPTVDGWSEREPDPASIAFVSSTSAAETVMSPPFEMMKGSVLTTAALPYWMWSTSRGPAAVVMVKDSMPPGNEIPKKRSSVTGPFSAGKLTGPKTPSEEPPMAKASKKTSVPIVPVTTIPAAVTGIAGVKVTEPSVTMKERPSVPSPSRSPSSRSTESDEIDAACTKPSEATMPPSSVPSSKSSRNVGEPPSYSPAGISACDR